MRSKPTFIRGVCCAVALAGLTACANSAPTGKRNPTYDTRAVTVAPRLAFLWNEQLTSWKFLGSEPREFATPTHIGATDELIVATSEGEVIKFQASNGAALWRHRFDAEYHAGAVVGGGHVFVGSLDGELRALQQFDGATTWTVQLDNSIETRGSYADGRLFVSDAADVLHAFDAATGERLWTHTRDMPEYFTVKGSCTPVADGDAVYCGFSDGNLVALQIDTGEVLWQSELGGEAKNFTDVDGPVVVTRDRIYAASYAGGVYALDRETGAPIWRTPVESTAQFKISGTRMFVASSVGRIVALNLEDGQPLWSFKLKQSFPGSLVAFGPYVIAFSTDGPVYMLDGESGYPHAKWRGTSGFAAVAELGSSRVYALTNGGSLLALKLGY